MRNFDILFDHAESSACDDLAYQRYGNFRFPPLPPGRPWIFANFVQTLDGIASFNGRHATGADISQLSGDRWLMDFLRAHPTRLCWASTLVEETQRIGNRGPIYAVKDPEIRKLREKLGRQRE